MVKVRDLIAHDRIAEKVRASAAGLHADFNIISLGAEGGAVEGISLRRDVPGGGGELLGLRVCVDGFVGIVYGPAGELLDRAIRLHITHIILRSWRRSHDKSAKFIGARNYDVNWVR